MKLKTGSNLLLASVIGVVSIVLLVGCYFSYTVQHEVQGLVDNSIEPRSAMTHSYSTAVVAAQYLQLAGASDDAEMRRANADLAQKSLASSKAAFERYSQRRLETAPESALDVQSNRRAAQPAWDVIEQAIAQVRTGVGPSWALQDRGPSALQAFGQMMVTTQGGYEDSYAKNVIAVKKGGQIVMIAFGIGFLVVLLMILTMKIMMRRHFFQPLSQLDQHFSKMANGDLRETIRFSSKNEIGDIFQSLECMQTSLSEIVQSVGDGVQAVEEDTELIANGSLDLSARTEQQSAALQQTASSMQELSSTVSQNAENAKQADLLAASAQEVASRGGVIMDDVIKRMGAIADNSLKISDIVNMIDSIAFQTNILALNAAVEAARAGEQGKGFAVVASEVRNLASRSAQAAKEIKALIETAAQDVSNGNMLVEEAGKTMREIVTSVSRVTDIMSEIASASNEQANGIEQINQAVSQMDDATHRNALLVQETASASASLKNSMSKVNGAISRLKVNPVQKYAGPVVLAAQKAHVIPAALTETTRGQSLKAPKALAAVQQPKRQVTRPSGQDIVSPLKGNASEEQDWEEF